MVSVAQFGRGRGCSICTTSTVAKNHVCVCVCVCVYVCVYMCEMERDRVCLYVNGMPALYDNYKRQ